MQGVALNLEEGVEAKLTLHQRRVFALNRCLLALYTNSTRECGRALSKLARDKLIGFVEKGRRVKLKCECHVGETLVLDGEGLLSVPPTPKWRNDAP